MDFLKIFIPDHRFYVIIVHFSSQYAHVAAIHSLPIIVVLFHEYIQTLMNASGDLGK